MPKYQVQPAVTVSQGATKTAASEGAYSDPKLVNLNVRYRSFSDEAIVSKMYCFNIGLKAWSEKGKRDFLIDRSTEPTPLVIIF
jgi:hypothetical protein